MCTHCERNAGEATLIFSQLERLCGVNPLFLLLQREVEGLEMGCGQSVATSGGGPIYEMTFDMTDSNSPPLGSSLHPGATPLFNSEEDQNLLNLVEGLPGVGGGSGADVLRMPGGRLVRVTPLQQRTTAS